MKKLILLAAMTAVATGASAANLNNIGALGSVQGDFRLLSEDLGAALSYKALAPAEPLGITGIDVGAEVTLTKLTNGDIFKKVTSGNKIDAIPVAKVHAHKGLPFGIDVGAFYSSVPDSNITLTGAELRYAILEGSTLVPAVAVRGTYTALGGVDQLELNTKGLELSVSKGFVMFTPYAGVGNIWVESTPKGLPLKSESFTETKSYVGLNLNLGLLNFAYEHDQTGDANTDSLKVGFRW